MDRTEMVTRKQVILLISNTIDSYAEDGVLSIVLNRPFAMGNFGRCTRDEGLGVCTPDPLVPEFPFPFPR